jgi:hypothetical protein
MRREVQVDLQRVIRIGGRDERLGLDRQQVVLTHHAPDPLVVDQHTAASQLGRHSTIAVATPVLQSDPLNHRPNLDIFLARSPAPAAIGRIPRG